MQRRFESFCLDTNGKREQTLLKRRRARGTCLRQWSRVNFCSADTYSSRVWQALGRKCTARANNSTSAFSTLEYFLDTFLYALERIECKEAFRLRLKSDALQTLNKPLLEASSNKPTSATTTRQREKASQIPN